MLRYQLTFGYSVVSATCDLLYSIIRPYFTVFYTSLFSAAKEDVPGAQRKGGRGQHQRNADVQTGPIKCTHSPIVTLQFTTCFLLTMFCMFLGNTVICRNRTHE